MTAARDPNAYELRAGWIFPALVAGAVTGALLTGLTFGLAALAHYGLEIGGGLGLLTFLFAVPFWVFGLVLVGGPFWSHMHQSGARDWRYAAALGAALVGVMPGLALGIFAAFGTGGWAPLFLIGFPLLFGSMGAATALVVWRIAYRANRGPAGELREVFQ